ncbi:unnamed protein product, partial [Hapterophycus canaliculatus]
LGLSAAAAGGVLCLYWADLGDNGGRWVLDDDLSLSNGVLAVTNGPAPAAADLAFVNHEHEHSHRGSRALASGRTRIGGKTESGSSGRVDALAEVEGSGAPDRIAVSEKGGGGRRDEISPNRPGEGAEHGIAGFGGGGARDGVTTDETEDAAVVGSPVSLPWSPAVSGAKAHPSWLLDSPRMQGWVEADDMFVLCETDCK